LIGWAVLFLAVALATGAIGFGFIFSASGGTAQILFYAALAAFLIIMVVHLMRSGGSGR
jgi:uncharacterized membrane protein YtjA (UPF0391 family)